MRAECYALTWRVLIWVAFLALAVSAQLSFWRQASGTKAAWEMLQNISVKAQRELLKEHNSFYGHGQFCVIFFFF
jgi:hypothetical protein